MIPGLTGAVPWNLFFVVLVILLAGSGAYFLDSRSNPQYGWLVFGRDARVRVLVCLDGEALSLTHYANGEPTGRNERFTRPQDLKEVAVSDPDGRASYMITGMSSQNVKAGQPAELVVEVHIKGPIDYRQYCVLVGMAGNTEGAPLAHFHGPLTVEASTINWKLPPNLSLQRGNKPTDLRAHVGTMDAQKRCWVVVRTHDDKSQSAFPQGVHPFVDVEFPSKEKAGPPVKRRFALDKVC
jgi:hypothetical protein